MSGDIYKMIYCSRSLIAGEPQEREAEIGRILATARVHNARHKITGALLYNSGCFAQALEGPEPAVKALFKKIQRDPRHGEVTVFRSAAGRRRDFPSWSMAHVQCESEDGFAAASATLEMALAGKGEQGARSQDLVRMAVLELLRTLVANQLEEAKDAQELLSS